MIDTHSFDYTISIDQFIQKYNIYADKYAKLAMSIFDFGMKGRVNFEEFIVALWNMLTMPLEVLLNFVWQCYDMDEFNKLLISDLRELTHIILGSGSKEDFDKLCDEMTELSTSDPNDKMKRDDYIKMMANSPIVHKIFDDNMMYLKDKTLGQRRWQHLSFSRVRQYKYSPINEILSTFKFSESKNTHAICFTKKNKILCSMNIFLPESERYKILEKESKIELIQKKTFHPDSKRRTEIENLKNPSKFNNRDIRKVGRKSIASTSGAALLHEIESDQRSRVIIKRLSIDMNLKTEVDRALGYKPYLRLNDTYITKTFDNSITVDDSEDNKLVGNRNRRNSTEQSNKPKPSSTSYAGYVKPNRNSAIYPYEILINNANNDSISTPTLPVKQFDGSKQPHLYYRNSRRRLTI